MLTTVSFVESSHSEGAYLPLIATFQKERLTIKMQFLPIDKFTDEITGRIDKHATDLRIDPSATSAYAHWEVAALAIDDVNFTVTLYRCWKWVKFLLTQSNMLPTVPTRTSVTNSATWKTAVRKELVDTYVIFFTCSQYHPTTYHWTPLPERSWCLWINEDALISASTSGDDATALLVTV
ncbi:MAG TPA: hypothetical protein ENK32_01985 [Anaerolineae bacterium]|nr:hypothetical protein [Anaerolineae bacterium]